MSVDEISGEDDIGSFVSSYSSLQQVPELPQLEYHHLSVSYSTLYTFPTYPELNIVYLDDSIVEECVFNYPKLQINPNIFYSIFYPQ